MTRDLTRGRIMPLLIKFTVPLVLGNLFQLTYNAVDSIIVGRFVGSDALAAVGVCSSVTALMILFFNGMCIGASVLIGTWYGAGDTEKLHRQVSTTMITGVVFSVFLSILTVILAKPILRIIQVEQSILPVTAGYMRIILAGLVFTFLYNFFSGSLRALGDTLSPLLFLIFSSLLNIVGDLFFVLVLHQGCSGCAVATVLSQAVSCLLCFLYIQKNVPVLRLGKKWLVFDRSLLRITISYGWASAMQQATVQLGKIVIQTIVNSMGVSVTAAFSAVNRIDDFALIPEQNIAHAMTAVMAQNRGAKQEARVREGFRSGIILETCYGILICLICNILAEPLMRLFVEDPEVIGHGVKYLKLISCMYVLPAVTNGVQGYFRGTGKMKITLLSSFVNMSFRVLTAVILVNTFRLETEALPWSYFAGWICMMITEVPILFKDIRLMLQKESGIRAT